MVRNGSERVSYHLRQQCQGGKETRATYGRKELTKILNDLTGYAFCKSLDSAKAVTQGWPSEGPPSAKFLLYALVYYDETTDF